MGSLQALVLAAAIAGGGGDDTVLLDFTARWCGPCQSMATTVRRLEDDRFPIQRIDVDEHPRMAEQWGVKSIPCFILVQGGREIERVEGVASYDRLVRMFERSGLQTGTTQFAANAEATLPVHQRYDVVRGQSPEKGSRSFAAPASAESELAPIAPATATPSTAQNYSASAHSQDVPSTQMEQAALAATVRLIVEDPTGRSYGTGTIVDVHGDEALVVTCGHLFRDSAGKGQISVDLVGIEGASSVAGQLIAYDAGELDIALVSIRPGRAVQAVAVAATQDMLKPGAAVFSVGCDNGGAPSIHRSRISDIDRYLRKHDAAQNIEVNGQPVDGRSGGGLFDAQGRLIGICNAADPQDNEGIFAGLRTIHWQLEQVGLAGIYQPQSSVTLVSTGNSATSASSATSEIPVPGADNRTVSSQDVAGASSHVSAALPALASALDSGAEVICVIRHPSQPDGQVVVLDSAAREAIARIARESSMVRGQNR